jgi:riboflavin kinase/FMN adenylyltransferase
VTSGSGAWAAAFAGLAGEQHALTIGNFDGVHRGHRHLLNQVIGAAARRKVRSLVVTFEPHPVAVLRPEAAPIRLCTPSTKVELLRAAGIDDVVVLPFDNDLASLSPEEFLQLLVDGARPTDMFVGEGFRFGRKRSGTTALMDEWGKQHGFETHVVAPLVDEEGVISSSRVRAALLAGDVKTAEKLLGRRARLAGKVEHGMARGRDLGYPTANLHIPPGLGIPADGIYVGYAHLDDRSNGPREALIYIGTSPTFGDRERIVEVYILDFQGDLYSQDLEVEFLAFVRADMAFESADALIARIAEDERVSRDILSRSTPEQLAKGG